MSFVLWVLGSLLAISLIGDNPYAALGLTGLAGIAFGLNVFVDEGSVMRLALPHPHTLVAQYGWLLDGAATLLLIFPSRWMALGFLLVPVSWLLRWWAQGRLIRRTAFDLPILALVLMVPVSLWASADLSLSMVPLGQIVAGINAYYAVVTRVETERELFWAVVGFIAIGALIALAAPFGVEWNKSKLFALPAIYGIFHQTWFKANPNVFAGAIGMVLPVSAAVWLYATLQPLSTRMQRVGRVLLTVGLAVMLAILLLTQSRGGLAAAALGLLLLLAFKGRWVLGPLLAAVGAASAFILTRFDVAWLADIFFSTDAIGGLAGRQEVWSRAVYALQDVPYTGIGLGVFPRALQVLYPLFLVGPDADVPHAHNLFLQVGVDLGLPGLVAFIAVLTLGLVMAWQTFRSAGRAAHHDQAAIAWGLFVSLVVLILHGLVDAPLWATKPVVLVWVALGLVAAAAERRAACHPEWTL